MLSFDFEEVFPQEFICPISHELMIDPVVVSDGFSYERKSIEKWFSIGSQISPLTGLPLSNTTLIPNFQLKSAIGRYKEMTSKEVSALREFYLPLGSLSVEQVIRLFNALDFSGCDDLVRQHAINGSVLMEIDAQRELDEFQLPLGFAAKKKALFTNIRHMQRAGVLKSLLEHNREDISKEQVFSLVRGKKDRLLLFEKHREQLRLQMLERQFEQELQEEIKRQNQQLLIETQREQDRLATIARQRQQVMEVQNLSFKEVKIAHSLQREQQLLREEELLKAYEQHISEVIRRNQQRQGNGPGTWEAMLYQELERRRERVLQLKKERELERECENNLKRESVEGTVTV